MNREDQFAGFAQLLFDDLLAISGVYIDTLRDDWREEWKQMLAQRAYDLVSHTFYNTGPMMLDCYSHEEQIAAIPDMTAWPEETRL